MNTDRYFAADKLQSSLVMPQSLQHAYFCFGEAYRHQIKWSDVFTPKPKAVVKIEQLMEGQHPDVAPDDEQWWSDLKKAVLDLYEGEVMLRAGVVTKQYLTEDGTLWRGLP